MSRMILDANHDKVLEKEGKLSSLESDCVLIGFVLDSPSLTKFLILFYRLYNWKKAFA